MQHNSSPRTGNDPILRFTFKGHLFQIARDYQGQKGYIGIRDGRIAARADSRAEVARVLITSH